MKFSKEQINDYAQKHKCTYDQAVTMLKRQGIEEYGGPGSGNFGHGGRPGEVGGSGEGTAGKAPEAKQPNPIFAGVTTDTLRTRHNALYNRILENDGGKGDEQEKIQQIRDELESRGEQW